MARIMETVLYYNPGKPEAMKHVAKMKSVLVRMGVRIRNISGEQVMETVGYLAGLPGFEAAGTAGGPAEAYSVSGAAEPAKTGSEAAGAAMPLPEIPEQVMVLKNFSGRRIDELLAGLRKAGVPKIELKAVLTESNSKWTFYQLYQELVEEHKAMMGEAGQADDDDRTSGPEAEGENGAVSRGKDK